jgi:hypothetical protein
LGPNNELLYNPSARGDILPDFSRVGYQEGAVPIPDVPVRVTVRPSYGDQTAPIQAAIDSVAKLPLVNGFRGAVLLTKGTYRISGSLRMAQSGVVLRGAGEDENGTVLVATGTGKRDLLVVGGEGYPVIDKASQVPITGAYVPFGRDTFNVSSGAGFKANDDVVVLWQNNAAWIQTLAMDRIPARAGRDTQSWTPFSVNFERTVLGVSGTSITVDAPLVQGMDARYGTASLAKYKFPGRMTDFGVEFLRLVSEYKAGQENSDESHANSAITIDKAENGWVRHVTALHFIYAAVNIEKYGKHVTVEDSACLDPVSKIEGGRRYSFNTDGSLNLFRRNRTRNGRHDFVTGAHVAGPNVFLDSVAEATHSDVGPHHRWAMGTLYDNIRAGDINVQNRGNLGTGHGWAGAQQVFWNCTGTSMICQQPPTAQNFSIGFVGARAAGTYGDDHTPCSWQSPGQHVPLRSLYEKQLAERLAKLPRMATKR